MRHAGFQDQLERLADPDAEAAAEPGPHAALAQQAMRPGESHGQHQDAIAGGEHGDTRMRVADHAIDAPGPLGEDEQDMTLVEPRARGPEGIHVRAPAAHGDAPDGAQDARERPPEQLRLGQDRRLPSHQRPEVAHDERRVEVAGMVGDHHQRAGEDAGIARDVLPALNPHPAQGQGSDHQPRAPHRQ